MLISGRDVAERLGADCGLHRVQVRALLASGLAGEPAKVGRTHLYDDAVVAELAKRRAMTDREIEDLCPRGPFIARLSAARAFHVAMPWEQQAVAVTEWYVPILTRVTMAIDRPIRFPFVATLADFVVWGADIVDWHPGSPVPGSSRQRRTRLEFATAGDWYAGFVNRRICLGPGYPFVVHGAPQGGADGRAPGQA